MGNPRLAHSCHTRSGDLIFGFVDKECSHSQFRYAERRAEDTSPFPKGDTEMYTFKKSLIAFVGMHCKRSIPALLIALAIVSLCRSCGWWRDYRHSRFCFLQHRIEGRTV